MKLTDADLNKLIHAFQDTKAVLPTLVVNATHAFHELRHIRGIVRDLIDAKNRNSVEDLDEALLNLDYYTHEWDGG